MATVNNSLAKKQQNVGLTAYLTNDAVKKQINSVVGGKDGQTFIASIISAVQVNPALQECSNSSILSAALLGESLKLSPSPQLGYYYLVPFKNTKKGVTEATFQIGWKGLYQLAVRSGQYQTIEVTPIKEGELVRYSRLTGEAVIKEIENDEEWEKAPTIGYYAYFKLINGFEKSMYWSKAKMEAHAKRYSQGYRQDLNKGTQYTFWSKNFDEMACKTMLRQLLGKYGIMSIEMQSAYESDQAVIKEDGSKDYVDTVYEAPQTPKEIEVKTETGYSKRTETEEAPKIEDEKKATKKKTIKAEPEENDAAAALFGEEGAE